MWYSLEGQEDLVLVIGLFVEYESVSEQLLQLATATDVSLHPGVQEGHAVAPVK